MPGSHWMIVTSPENYTIGRSTNFGLLGLRSRHRKKAERMAQGDRVLYYVLDERVFPATATVTSSYYEDRHPIWVPTAGSEDVYPYRVHTVPNIVLEPWEELDAYAIAPRMLYVKRWPPEQWYLAFQTDVHLLSAQDFLLVEHEMERIVAGRGGRRERRPARPSSQRVRGLPCGVSAGHAPPEDT